MIDMSQTIIAKGNQLNADDLIAGPRTITITAVQADPASPEQPVTVHFDGDDGRPFKPCKTVRRIMVGCWGVDASQYIGRSLTLYCDPSVKFGGMAVGGIRVSHASHIDGDKVLALMVTRGKRAPYTVKPLTNAPKQPNTNDLKADARNAAGKGTDALKAFWGTIGKQAQGLLVDDMPEFKALAADVDKQRDNPVDDPFATTLDDGLTEDQRAARPLTAEEIDEQDARMAGES